MTDLTASRRNFLHAGLLGPAAGLLLSQFAANAAEPGKGNRASDDFPNVEVHGIRRVFHNGEHNAFTDLCWFNHRIYLAFRSCPDGHMVHPTSCIIILCSDDQGTSWKEVHRFSVHHRDTRDPHFLVFKNRLFVLTGTWYSGATTLPREDYDLNLHLGYCAWSDDGATWHSPIMLEGTFGHYIWRAATFGDKAYLCGRRKPEFEVKARGEGREVESLMLESNDGLVWRRSTVFQSSLGDETAFLFESDGSGLAIARHGQGKEAGLLRCASPGSEWIRTELNEPVGGPLLTKWLNHYVVAGRKTSGSDGPKTVFWWLDQNRLKEFAVLPSAGDNSYPGLVPLSESTALISWYSSHEKDGKGQPITAIYLAELRAK
ncbi:MAG: hypothetical protein U0996_15770 [Planctomycetaceae bacterium]